MADFERIFREIAEIRECKHELATLKEHKIGSDEKFKEIKENISKLFNRLEGNEATKGLKGEIADIQKLLSKFEENIIEVYDRIEKIEELLERTIKEVYELTPMVRALMAIEDDRKAEKSSFRKEFRMWVIGFIATVILTGATTWIQVKSSNLTNKDVVNIIMQVENQRDSLRIVKIRDSIKK